MKKLMCLLLLAGTAVTLHAKSPRFRLLNPPRSGHHLHPRTSEPSWFRKHLLKIQLLRHGQSIWQDASPSEELIEELKGIDFRLLAKQQRAINDYSSENERVVSPLNALPEPIAHTHPCDALRDRKIGCLVMAGGQATRLGMDSPKGIIPVSPLHKKSLLQIIAEKVVAFSSCYETSVPLAIMTSCFSRQEIVDHFEENDFFGLDPAQVSFCAQGSLPLLDMNSQLIIDDDGHLAQGPDGNGSLFSACAGVLEAWQQQQIEVVSIIQVDNPLLDPFHPAVLSPLFSGHDVVAAAIQRTDPNEKVGLFANENDHLVVAEYSEFPPETLSENFEWANISYFASTLDFALKASTHTLPLHMAKKSFQGQDAWKAEYFIFDHLLFAQNPAVIPIERSLFFSPVKNKEGDSSIETAQQAMIARDRNRLQELEGQSTSEVIELPQEAYYPAPICVEPAENNARSPAREEATVEPSQESVHQPVTETTTVEPTESARSSYQEETAVEPTQESIHTPVIETTTVEPTESARSSSQEETAVEPLQEESVHLPVQQND